MLFGVVMDNIGRGMIFGAIIGLCAAALKGKNKSEDHDQNDEGR